MQNGAFFREFRKITPCDVYIPKVVIHELHRKIFKEQRGRADSFTSTATQLLNSINELQGSSMQPFLRDTESGDLAGLAKSLPLLSINVSIPKMEKEVIDYLQKLMGAIHVLPYPKISIEDVVFRCCIFEKRTFPTATEKQDKQNKQDSDRSFRDTIQL